MTKRYDMVIFDWDGTLMDSEAVIVTCLRHAARVNDLTLWDDKKLASIIGLSLMKAVQTLWPDASPAQWQGAYDAYRQHFLVDCPLESSPFDGVEVTLQQLQRQGYRLAIATGKSRLGLEKVLAQTGFAQYFEMVKVAEETASKPDPLMLQEIQQESGIPLERLVMVGDTSFDLEMAQRLGMDSIAISHGVHDDEVLLQYAPRALIHHISELLPLV